MTQKRLARVIFTLLLALILLPPGAGTAEDATHIARLSPGDGSRLVSPIPISAEILSEPGGLVRVELLDGQGQAIARQLLRLDPDHNSPRQTFTTELPFEIRGEEETALLTLTLLDAFHRPLALRSSQITLRADGEAQIEPYQEDSPWINLTEPQLMDIVTGGQLTVVGTVTPLTESPVILELLDETGRVIGARQMPVEPPGSPFDFETTLVYTYIQTFTDARLVVRQTFSPFNTTAILDSLPIGVAP
jgi:hypothetical protein